MTEILHVILFVFSIILFVFSVYNLFKLFYNRRNCAHKSLISILTSELSYHKWKNEYYDAYELYDMTYSEVKKNRENLLLFQREYEEDLEWNDDIHKPEETKKILDLVSENTKISEKKLAKYEKRMLAILADKRREFMKFDSDIIIPFGIKEKKWLEEHQRS